MKKLKIFVTGPLEAMNEQAEEKRLEVVSLTCRRIILTRHIAVCPYMLVIPWMKDPRFIHDGIWWVSNYMAPLMEECDIFCHIPILAGNFSKSLEMQKDMWRALGKETPVTTDTVTNYLLHRATKEILS